MEIKIGVSARHIHLSQEDLSILFGQNYRLTEFQPLSQTGEFASNETVNIITEQGCINNVRILGPIREYTQVEITKTDAYKLKINPPVRNSGDLDNSSLVTIEGPYNSVTKNCCIIATRHIHLHPDTAKKHNLKHNEIVSVECETGKKTIFKDVSVKVKSSYVDEMHIDNDDSNGNLLFQGDIGTVKKMVN